MWVYFGELSSGLSHRNQTQRPHAPGGGGWQGREHASERQIRSGWCWLEGHKAIPVSFSRDDIVDRGTYFRYLGR